ncbi:MAG: hypothetical protein HUJ26_18185 [Planctomycetaceae bacterium]|nr:hypothetical protein [Planctomycetaceae bacterium]
MSANRHERYPYHLAKLVFRGLRDYTATPPSEKILLKLFETLYFTSLKTDELRSSRCTLNYLDPQDAHAFLSSRENRSGWSVSPLAEPIPCNVHSLLKISEAVDPTVSSLAVTSDQEGNLFIWALVDQELRYGNHLALDALADPVRPGLFQSTITGVGSISVSKNFKLLGCLEQNHLITSYHDVLWTGPIHRKIQALLDTYLGNLLKSRAGLIDANLMAAFRDELFVRWQNSLCRILYNIQQYRHGGGLLIVPECPVPDVNIKYGLNYSRLPESLIRLCTQQIAKRETMQAISLECLTTNGMLKYDQYVESIQRQDDLDRLKTEVLGCNRFVASLSNVDGFVLLDRSLSVRGFGVEARTDDPITSVAVAGDAEASRQNLQKTPIDHYGTRHRAMIRYCNRHAESLGFVVSQDGDIRAITRRGDDVILWENINVQLSYRSELRRIDGSHETPLSDKLHEWFFSSHQRRSA